MTLSTRRLCWHAATALLVITFVVCMTLEALSSVGKDSPLGYNWKRVGFLPITARSERGRC